MPKTEVWTKAGLVSMSIEEADAYRAREVVLAARRKRDLQRLALRICAGVTLFWCATVLLNTVVAALRIGAPEQVVDIALVLSWDVAGAVCAVCTWAFSRAPDRAEGEGE